MNEPAPKRQVPLGEPISWSDEDLDEMSEITPADIEEAHGWAERNARPRDKRLWKAKVTE